MGEAHRITQDMPTPREQFFANNESINCEQALLAAWGKANGLEFGDDAMPGRDDMYLCTEILPRVAQELRSLVLRAESDAGLRTELDAFCDLQVPQREDIPEELGRVFEGVDLSKKQTLH